MGAGRRDRWDLRRAATLLLFFALCACRDRWRERVDPERAKADPEQVALETAAPIVFEKNGHSVRLQPRATYRITGYAIDISTALLDKWDFAMPMDVALAWGPAARPAVLLNTRTHLTARYLSFWYQGPEAASANLQRHLSNNHLIPSGPAVEKAMRRIREGDLVTLRGLLVDVEIRNRTGAVGFRSPTSLSRDDVGSGACEQIWVEDVEVER